MPTPTSSARPRDFKPIAPRPTPSSRPDRKPSLAHQLRVNGHAVWLAARDPRCPWSARIVGLIIGAYALSPIDLIPDFIPVIGLLDDAILVPLGLWIMAKLIPDALWAEHRAAAEAASQHPVSRGGIVIVIAVWLTVLAAFGWWMYARYD